MPEFIPFKGLLPEFFEISAALADAGGPDLAVSGLRGGAVPLAAAEIAVSRKGPILIIAPDANSAKRLFGDLNFFLQSVGGAKRLYYYPPYDVAPYESLSPHSAITAARLSALAALGSPRSEAVVISAVGPLLKRVIPRSKLSASALDVRVGEEADREIMIYALEESGYHRAPLVEDVGEYAVRGGVIDFWSPLLSDPTRIELFGDEIRSIRSFSPARQTTMKHIDRARIFACRETIISEETPGLFAERVKPLADGQNVDRRIRDRLVDEMRARISTPGIEFLLPLFYDGLDTIADYLSSESTILLVDPDLTEAMAHTEQSVIEKRRERAREAGKLCVEYESLYQNAEKFFEGLNHLRHVTAGSEVAPPRGKGKEFRFEAETHSQLREEILSRAKGEKMLEPLTKRLEAWIEKGYRTALVARGPSGADRLRRLLDGYDLSYAYDKDDNIADFLGRPASMRIPILIGELSAGALIESAQTALVTEEEIFGPRKRSEAYRGKKGEPISDFGDLSEGDAIVHVRHGIGIFRGLVRLLLWGAEGEYLHIEYAGGDKLYLPVDRLALVQRYVGAGESMPKIDKLGGGGWDIKKRRAKAAIRKMAGQLIKLYARRESMPGYAFPDGGELFEEFEGTFPYDETPDQITTIDSVIEDMKKDRPMDRLVCGDVGFGKTEVALRAAFLAVMDGKQAAILAPTTTLAFQHLRTFTSRMNPFGVRVKMLSRFVEPKDRQKTMKDLEAGDVDVIIGTHQLLGKKIKFKDLGLLVVDEEQLFGVAQKEKIKSMKELVDVLAMTATPIPRTLHMSLVGIRDMSVINTAPEDRLAVRTFITRWDEDTLGSALRRELGRGGQVFFIHNRVQSIDGMADKVRRLAPSARIRIGHGQMPGEQIEQLLIDFAERRFDILVATTIVGSGLDYPQANTIIINRADMLGLAQLYQLRGRVGRSKTQAFCYLVIPERAKIGKDARRRLAAIKNFSELGSGYKVAGKDLEIRGAGNLLGGEQSGHITAIGYELFRELLDEEIRRLKGEDVPDKIETEINLGIAAYIPKEYIPPESIRLGAYKRISEVPDEKSLDSVRAEILDRFGDAPDELVRLFDIVSLKILAKPLRISAIDYNKEALTFTFDASTPVKISRLVEMVSRAPKRYRLLPDGKLMEIIGKVSGNRLFAAVRQGLIALNIYDNNREPEGEVLSNK